MPSTVGAAPALSQPVAAPSQASRPSSSVRAVSQPRPTRAKVLREPIEVPPPSAGDDRLLQFTQALVRTHEENAAEREDREKYVADLAALATLATWAEEPGPLGGEVTPEESDRAQEEEDVEMKEEEASPQSPTESASPAEAAAPIEIEVEPLPDVAAQLEAELLTESTQRLLQDPVVLFVGQPRPCLLYTSDAADE